MNPSTEVSITTSLCRVKMNRALKRGGRDTLDLEAQTPQVLTGAVHNICGSELREMRRFSQSDGILSFFIFYTPNVTHGASRLLVGLPAVEKRPPERIELVQVRLQTTPAGNDMPYFRNVGKA